MKKALRWLRATWPVLIWGVPLVAAAAGLVPCGNDPSGVDSLLATSCNLCNLGQLIQNVINFLLLISIPITAFLFLTAGVVWVTSGGSPAKIMHGKKILFSAVIGFIIVCAAWLIVQTIVVGLATNSTIFTGGNWTTVNCVDNNQRPRDKTLSDLLNFNSTTTPPPIPGSPGGPAGVPGICNNAGCTVSALQAAGFNPSQAAAMSCIAATESANIGGIGCNGNACGTFQIMLTVNPLVGPDCSPTGSLNCPVLCKGNNGVAVTTAACQPCVQAANNYACNAEAAKNLFNQSKYAPWTTASDNTKSAACIRQYDPPTAVALMFDRPVALSTPMKI